VAAVVPDQPAAGGGDDHHQSGQDGQDPPLNLLRGEVCRPYAPMFAFLRDESGANPDLTLEGIVMTMYDSRLNLSQQVVGDVRNYFKDSQIRRIG
jgi:hypothetical protein